MGSFPKRRGHFERPAHSANLLGSQTPGRKLLERTQANAIGFAQGTIDGTGFGHTQLGMVEDHGGNIAGMGVTVTNEATAFRRFEDRRLEHPEVFLGAAEGKNWFSVNSCTS